MTGVTAEGEGGGQDNAASPWIVFRHRVETVFGVAFKTANTEKRNKCSPGAIVEVGTMISHLLKNKFVAAFWQGRVMGNMHIHGGHVKSVVGEQHGKDWPY